MSSEWPLRKITEITDSLNHKRVPLSGMDRQNRQGQYPYYGASGIVDYIDDYIYDGTYLLISEDGENLRSRNTPIAFKAHGKFWVNNHAHILDEKEEGILDYLKYYFSQLNLSPYITGAVQPKLNKGNLHKIDIRVPPLEQRLQINDILNGFTKKIHLNQQANETLQAMAQAIFKSWFVDFDPVRAKIEATSADRDPNRAAMAVIAGISLDQSWDEIETAIDQKLATMSEAQQQQLICTAQLFPDELVGGEIGMVPKGWGYDKLGNFITVKRGGSPRPIKDFVVPEGLHWTKISDATAENSPFIMTTKEFIKEEGLKKTVLLDKGSLILSNSATPGLPKFLNIDACIHDGWLYFPEKEYFTDLYLYHLFIEIRKALVAKGSGTVFTNLKTSILRNYEVVVPNEELVMKFTDTAQSIFASLLNNREETDSLTNLRDTLLPKLISGEVGV